VRKQRASRDDRPKAPCVFELRDPLQSLNAAIAAADAGRFAPENIDDLPRPRLEHAAQKLRRAVGVLGRSLTVAERLLAGVGQATQPRAHG
jgi:hypothetical protein